MAWYFSPSTLGFYSDDWHGPRLLPVPGSAPLIQIANPDCRIVEDALEITDAVHDSLVAAQAAGKVIVAGDGGQPVAADPPAPTDAALWLARQDQATIALKESDITVLRCLERGEAVPPEWTTYRTELRAIISATSGDPTQPFSTKPAYPAGS